MDYSKKARGSGKQQHNSIRNQGGNSGRNEQTSNRPLYSAHFTRRQNLEESSKIRVLRPPIRPLPPNFKGEFSKVTRGVKSLTLQETAEEKKDRLKSQLLKFESPFNWRPRQVKPVNEPETIINRMKIKDEEIKDERKFKWRNFIFHLVICYESWRAKNLSQAFEEVCGLESMLLAPSNRGDYMFACIADALQHVVNACKTFLYLEQDLVAKAEEMIQMIQPIGTMSRQNQAGIHGIKAAMFMEYGHRGNKNALVEVHEAIKLDRTNAEWHFFISKCMGRIRRVAQCHERVNFEEVRSINRAIKLDERNATYRVFLAQVLSERAFREYKKDYPVCRSEQDIKIRKTNKAAMHNFKEAVKLSPNSPHILIRSARGLMKLPPALKDLKFMKECIDKAVELAPNNPMVHHVKAMYHERFDCDADVQLEAYEKAASLDNYGAAMDLIRLHHNLKCGNIVEELDTMAAKYEEIDRLQVIYTQAGSYLLFIKKDIISALKYYLKVIEIDNKSYAMMSHKPIFFRMKDPVNMFDVLLEELTSNTNWGSFPPEDRQVLKTFAAMTAEHQPLPTEQKKRLTVQEILEMSWKATERDNMYKETKAAGKRRREIKRVQNKSAKRWKGSKKSESKNKDVKVRSGANEKLSSNEKRNEKKKEIKKNDRGNSNNIVETKRRDSVSSVDSDYYRDSTKFGPRGFFLQGSNESLCFKTSEKYDSHNQNNSIYREFKESNFSRRSYSHSSRDSSISSIPSACSSVDFISSQGSKVLYPQGNTTGDGQLSVENLKKFDIENSYDTGIRRLSMLSLSSAGSVSQASSSDTLSVMDRVAQSYAMLNLNSQPSRGNKKPSKKHGSTQSLNTQDAADWRKGNKNIPKSESSQSVNVMEENLDRKFRKSFQSRCSLRDSSIESTRSFSFMPAFACKNSESNLEKP